MLLLAKDLIRRLIQGSVQLWNEEESKLKHDLQEARGTLDQVQAVYKTEQAVREKGEAQLGHVIDASEKETRLAHKSTLQAEIRADKMERDYLMARNELVETRDKKAKLEERVVHLERLVADSVWSGAKVEELVKSLKTQPLKTRRRVASAMLEIEAEAGTMYMFCKEMATYMTDPRQSDSQIAMAFTMHLVEGSDDPMLILRDLSAQRQRVLGRQGKFGIDARPKNVWSQTDPMPEPERIIVKEVLHEKKRRSFIETKPKPKITPKEEEVLQEIQEEAIYINQVKNEAVPVVEHDVAPETVPPEAKLKPLSKPVTPASPGSKPQSAASSVKSKSSRKSTPYKGEMLPGAIQKWIPQIFEAKLIQDEIDMGGGRKVLSMKAFIEEYFPRKYGLPALAKKAVAELFNGLRVFLSSNKRIQLFAACCGIELPDKEMAREFTSFMLKCISRCMPVEVVTEKMSKKECEVDVETVNRALEFLFQGELEPVTPSFREEFIKMCRIGKNNKSLPALEIDDYLGRCMQEWCAIKQVDPPVVLKYLHELDHSRFLRLG